AQDGGGRLQIFPVSEHELGSAHDEFSGVAGGNFFIVEIENATFGERERLADRGRTVHLGWSQESYVSDWRCLGHAIALVHGDASEVTKTTGEFGGEWGGTGLDPTDFVVFREAPGFGSLAKRVDGGRDHRHHGDTVLRKE